MPSGRQTGRGRCRGCSESRGGAGGPRKRRSRPPETKRHAPKPPPLRLRAQLLKQLNEVLQTTDTPRGLVVNMADVLFETNKYALSQDAQLKLAKLSGIIQAHPGLNLAIEGYTDTTGTPDYNLKLSQQRADTVRDFLISQGLSADTITAKGLGQANPVADNSTAAGRKLNRRVEIIVSGEVIGVKDGKVEFAKEQKRAASA